MSDLSFSVFALHSLGDVSFSTRDRTRVLAMGTLTTGPQGKSPLFFAPQTFRIRAVHWNLLEALGNTDA